MSRLPDLVCIVPVYNEAEVLERSVRLLTGALEEQLGAQNFHLIIASNGSTDATADIGRALEAKFTPHVKLLVLGQKGRGLALREAIGAIPAKRYLYIDVDLPCELADLAAVLAPLNDGADLVTCRRTGYRPAIRRLMTWGLRQANRLVFGLRVSDSQCAVKALSPAAARVLAQDCGQDGWYLDTEVVVLAARRGLDVREVQIRWIEQRFPGRLSKVKPLADILACAKAFREILERRRDLPPAPDVAPG